MVCLEALTLWNGLQNHGEDDSDANLVQRPQNPPRLFKIGGFHAKSHADTNIYIYDPIQRNESDVKLLTTQYITINYNKKEQN